MKHLKFNLIAILTAIATFPAFAEYITLFSTDFSSSDWVGHETICAGEIREEEDVNGIYFRCDNASKEYTIADGALTFCNNNFDSKYYFAIPLQKVKDSVIVIIGTVNEKKQRIAYLIKETNVIDHDVNGKKNTNAGDNTNYQIRLGYKMTGGGSQALVMIGRQGSGYPTVIKTITIMTYSDGIDEPELSSDATLASVNILDEPLEGFESNKFKYDITLTKLQVALLAATQNITYTTTDPNAKVAWEYTSTSDNMGFVTITVTAEDGVTTQQYIVNVLITDDTPALSTDATLSAILIDNQALTTFSASVYEYDVTTKYDENNNPIWPNVTATKNDDKASVDIKSQTQDNKMIYTITVTAEDNATSLIYTVTITAVAEEQPQLSDDATLSAILIDNQALTTFSASVYEYDVTTKYDENNNPIWPNVTATKNDDKASVDVKSQTQDNKMIYTITVTAEDNTTSLIYTVTITAVAEEQPQLSDDATLSAILIDNQALTTFSASVYEYDVTTKYDENNNPIWPTVTATKNDDKASVDVKSQSQDNKMIYTITVTAEDNVTSRTYTLTITAVAEEQPQLSDDATLSAIMIDGKTISGFKPETTNYNITIDADAAGLLTWTTNDPKAIAELLEETTLGDNKKQYTIAVMAEDASSKLYVVVVTRQASSEIPTTKLACHYPEKYETMTTFGGYGGTLRKLNGREFEVYQLARYKVDGTNVVGVSVSESPTPTANSIISVNETDKSFDSKDNWFIGRCANGHSSASDETKYDEFAGIFLKYKMVAGDSIVMHVSGYDQFRLLAKDNNADANKHRNIDVYIDGVLQSQILSTSPSVRIFDMSSGEHVISIQASGASNNEIYAWSLRLTNEPLVKYLSGNDSTQEVNQTQAIQPIKYAIKNFVGSRLSWVGNSADGISLTPLNAIGDTMQLDGVTTAPVGIYKYVVEALDANNNVSTSIAGEFKVKTELVADTTNATVWINDNMSFPFTYYATSANAINFSWTENTPNGLTTTVIDDHTYAITGTPKKEGTFPYSISIEGGNTLTGTIIVDIPEPQLIAPEPNVVHVKPGQLITDIVWNVKFASNATVSGLPKGLSGIYGNGKFVISGTPKALDNYPQTFTYTITATPEYTGKSSVVATGQIIVIDPNAKSLLFLYKDNYNDAIYYYLNGKYDVTPRTTEEHMRNAADYNYYNVIVISENVDANNGEVLDVITRLNKPILNMKSFTYSSSRLGWGNPNNGSINNVSIKAIQPEHPIFSEYASKDQFQLPLLTDVDLRGIQPVEVTLKGSSCLAVAPIRDREYEADGEYQTAIHEVPGNLRGNGITARYLLLPIAQRSAQYTSQAARLLIDAAISYLANNETGYVLTLPELAITSFSVEGVNATINEATKTITCVVPDGTDLSNVVPVITLADNTTHTIPEQGTAVDLSDSHFGVEFTVSDYINKVTYNVKCRTVTAIENNSLSGVSYDAASGMLINNEGHMLYIYDVMGRLVNVANTTISLSGMPHGIYLIQSQDAMMKIMK